MSGSTTNHFPPIRTLADRTDDIQDTTIDTDADQATEQVESLCMKCGEQGLTHLMLTSIPYFSEIIVMSFRCDHCGNANNEIQAAGAIRPEGTVYTARITSRADLDRQIVRAPSCTVIIPEYALTLPPTSRGQLTTVEGLLREIVSDLSADQPLRRIQDENSWKKIEDLLGNLRTVIGEESDRDEDGPVAKTEKAVPSFTITLDDPSGNSFIEFIGSMADPKWSFRTYQRTKQDDINLGVAIDGGEGRNWRDENEEVQDGEGATADEEVYTFPGLCSSCGAPLDTKMKKVSVPYFKDIFIMSTNCDRCGYRDNEVKSGTAVSAMGQRITLNVQNRDDLCRDLLKSDTAKMSIPEIELELQSGTLGGRFTTVEGILKQVHDELSQKVIAGDSSEDSAKFDVFLKRLDELISGSSLFTLILDDPMANSYLQSLRAPDPDPQLDMEMYERTWEQNEELGLNDIKVEGYEYQEEDVKS